MVDKSIIEDTISFKKHMDCPNCINDCKCKGPHLIKKYDGLYSSVDGYYMYSSSQDKYVFIPHEKEYDDQKLLDISNTLRVLNDILHK